MKLKKKKKNPFLSENFILTETQNSKSIRNKQTSNKMKITSWWALFHQQPIKDYSYTNIHVTKASASIKKKKKKKTGTCKPDDCRAFVRNGKKELLQRNER